MASTDIRLTENRAKEIVHALIQQEHYCAVQAILTWGDVHAH